MSLNLNLPVKPPRSRLPAPGRAWLIFSFWGVSVIGLIAGLSREACAMSAPIELGLPPGWTMRHWLPAGHPLTPLIVAQLAQRGPLTGITDEIYLTDPSGRFGPELRREGWPVQLAATGPEPRVEIYSPDRVLRWSGTFRAADFATEGAVMLDTVVLRNIARGQVMPPYVPVGCGTGPARGPKTI